MDHCNKFARNRFTVTQIVFEKLSSNREFFKFFWYFGWNWVDILNVSEEKLPCVMIKSFLQK